ncbi:MAG: FAD-binding dehydrogenase [Oleiphilaceae bacterium]|nr:FAD-binding dehydrogenase [Oleiphilaceae bacterium]
MSESDVLIIGAGIAGMVSAYECLEKGLRVTVVERDSRERVGGLARWAFGGMAIVDTPLQQRMKIQDSPEIAWRDWQNFAEYEANTHWEQAWGKYYVEHSREAVYDYLYQKGLRFFPAVNWVERGLYGEGNSLPRYHVLWGTGQRLVDRFSELLRPYEQNGKLTLLFDTRCESLICQQDRVCGAVTVSEENGATQELKAAHTIVATGGINGSLQKVRHAWGDAPEELLNGAHPFADGHLHDVVEALGGKVTHLQNMWNYAAGIPHPKPHFDGHGLSLIPCKSALWLDHEGKRIGPEPLVTGFDTHELCRRVALLERPYTWQVLNWKIAAKELAVSGSEHNPSIRDRKLFSFLKEVLLGNHRLIKQLQHESDHFIVADNPAQLAQKMNALQGDDAVNEQTLHATITAYDRMIQRGESLWNDDQLRRIQHARNWRSDKLRTCKPEPMLKAGNGPLIAIKLRVITRKSLGGIQTNLSSAVLDKQERAIPGLYAVGEAAGFGGGGASGKRSLEGTFLSGCIITAQAAAKAVSHNS